MAKGAGSVVVGSGGEGGEIVLEDGPGARIFFCGKGRRGIGKVAEDVGLDTGWDGLGGGGGETMEEGGVGGVGERIASGLHGAAGVEVAVGEGVLGVG